MLLTLIFIALGAGALSKKEIFISSKRKLGGKKAKILGILFLATGLTGLLGRVPIFAIIYSLLFIISIIAALFAVIFSKGNQATQVPTPPPNLPSN